MGRTGFEPVTIHLTGGRTTKLCYRPTKLSSALFLHAILYKYAQLTLSYGKQTRLLFEDKKTSSREHACYSDTCTSYLSRRHNLRLPYQDTRTRNRRCPAFMHPAEVRISRPVLFERFVCVRDGRFAERAIPDVLVLAFEHAIPFRDNNRQFSRFHGRRDFKFVQDAFQ